MPNSIFKFESEKTIEWSIAIFASRENLLDICSLIISIEKSVRKVALIDVLVNGNTSLGKEIVTWLRSHLQESPASINIRVWQIPLLNKAHVWNQYIHHIWPNSIIAYFIDGNVRLAPETLINTEKALQNKQSALAASSLWVNSSASSIDQNDDGTSHFLGGYFALRSATIRELRGRAICLPVGLYGFDTVLGGLLGYGLDPTQNVWNFEKYVATSQNMLWYLKGKSWWRISDIGTHIRRIKNNALRKLVRKATVHYLSELKYKPENLPKTIEDYVMKWVDEDYWGVINVVVRAPLVVFVLYGLRKPRDWSMATKLPELKFIFKTNSEQ